MFRTSIFLSVSLFVHGTLGVCLWTGARLGSDEMSFKRGDNSANIVIVSPGELHLKKSSAGQDLQKDLSNEREEDLGDFIQPLQIEKKDTVLIPPQKGSLKSTAGKPGNEFVTPSKWSDEKETLGKDQIKQNAVCIVIPGRQIGVDTFSQASSVNPTPRYPKIAILKGWEGETVVKVSVNMEGRVEHIEVIQSSGHTALDNAVIETLQFWQFEKGRAKDLEIPIRFILKNAAN